MQLRPEKISNVWLVRDGIVNWFSETIWGRRRSEKNMTKKFLPCPTRFKLRGVSCRLSKLKRSRWELNLWTFAGSRRASIVFLRQILQKLSSLDPCPINFFPIKRAFFRERIWFRSLLNENHENLILKHVWLPRFLPQKKNLCSLIFTREKNVRRLSPKNESSSDRLVPSSFPVSFFRLRFYDRKSTSQIRILLLGIDERTSLVSMQGEDANVTDTTAVLSRRSRFCKTRFVSAAYKIYRGCSRWPPPIRLAEALRKGIRSACWKLELGGSDNSNICINNCQAAKREEDLKDFLMSAYHQMWFPIDKGWTTWKKDSQQKKLTFPPRCRTIL